MGTHAYDLTMDDSFTDGGISQEAEEDNAALQHPGQTERVQMQCASETEVLMVLASSDCSGRGTLGLGRGVLLFIVFYLS